MVDTQTVVDIAGKVAQQVAAADFERVVTEPATDSEGKEALRIIVVLKPEASERFNGDRALDLLVGVQRELLRQGEQRLPIIEYATESELGQEHDDEDFELREDEV